MELKVVITDPIGLHARPASVIVQEANKYDSEIIIKVNDEDANLKSIMSVMALGIKKGIEVTIIATGDDEKDAIFGIQKALKENDLV